MQYYFDNRLLYIIWYELWTDSYWSLQSFIAQFGFIFHISRFLIIFTLVRYYVTHLWNMTVYRYTEYETVIFLSTFFCYIYHDKFSIFCCTYGIIFLRNLHFRMPLFFARFSLLVIFVTLLYFIQLWFILLDLRVSAYFNHIVFDYATILDCLSMVAWEEVSLSLMNISVGWSLQLRGVITYG